MKYCMRMRDKPGPGVEEDEKVHMNEVLYKDERWTRPDMDEDKRRCMNEILYKDERWTRPGMDEDEKVHEWSIV